ncbi:MAG: phenylalanine-4-hydroxylase [Candidatus Azotimanducaceae bacterium]|jgi:phenylalanine-4-hydroxylase
MDQAEIKRQLPSHLRQFVADQDYASRYSAKDQAVWRFVMHQLVQQLKHSAHPVYFEGLKKTGISLDAIPSIDDMNACLAKLGWRAIVVDGFIPPQAFMELQSLRVLAIALDMRSIHHIEYTPAPDIIHEAAGHTPIIVDVEYSDYLQRFGEVGMKAIYNQYDLDLYEAVRQLSIIKESDEATEHEITAAETTLELLVSNPGQPSELALLTRLHWWTVEYGLVGDSNHTAIFGAGLLSSLEESLICMDDNRVKKLPLTIDAIKTAYDITTLQPQLFVTKSCRHLTQILDEYAKTMCFQTGGARSIETAIEAKVVTSCELSSGITVSGRFTRLLKNVIDEVIYISTEGPSQISLDGTELEGHSIAYHAEGFGSPVGRICNLMKPLESASEYELQEMNIRRGEITTLDFLSGITVTGRLKSMYKERGLMLLMTFEDCIVLDPAGNTLFDPAWGYYDMVVGESVRSVFAGSADPTQFDVYPAASTRKTHRGEQDQNEIDLYQQVQNLHPTGRGGNEVETEAEIIALRALHDFPDSWLLLINLLAHVPADSKIQIALTAHLNALMVSQPKLAKLITRGLNSLHDDTSL